ncbi:Hypothetical Protein OBI_RACECAR_229 [Arthrobacter phage Racecar]|nr:hypothetical protein PBI_RACECAR_21 [Arthrobacter phage Racecar]QFG12705.1 hypothetical protein PBI_MIMI_21 [Arthrobacter phage Mimi]
MENTEEMTKEKALSILSEVAYLMGHAEGRGEDLSEYEEDHLVAYNRAKKYGATSSELERIYQNGHQTGKLAYEKKAGTLSRFFGMAEKKDSTPKEETTASAPAPMLHNALERHPEGQVRVYSKSGKLVMGTSVSGYLAELEEWRGKPEED